MHSIITIGCIHFSMYSYSQIDAHKRIELPSGKTWMFSSWWPNFEPSRLPVCEGLCYIACVCCPLLTYASSYYLVCANLSRTRPFVGITKIKTCCTQDNALTLPITTNNNNIPTNARNEFELSILSSLMRLFIQNKKK